jgi:hypothetical protein
MLIELQKFPFLGGDRRKGGKKRMTGMNKIEGIMYLCIKIA